jgi:hypothetical protein
MYFDMRKGNGNCRIVKEDLEVILRKLYVLGKWDQIKQAKKKTC